MPSADIYPFPRTPRRRPPPYQLLPRVPYGRPPSYRFGYLLIATLATAFLYLSGAAGMARHDGLYMGLLVVVWGVYFASGPLLRMRLLGPALARAGRVLAITGFASFFAFVYWLVLSH